MYMSLKYYTFSTSRNAEIKIYTLYYTYRKNIHIKDKNNC